MKLHWVFFILQQYGVKYFIRNGSTPKLNPLYLKKQVVMAIRYMANQIEKTHLDGT